MKSTIRTGVLLVLLAGIMVAPALEQDGGHGMGHGQGGDPADRVERHVSHLENQLDLSEAQVNQVEAILKDSNAEAAAFRKSHREAARAEIEGILTDEQKATFADMGRDMRERSGGAGRLMEKLNLTDDQKSQLKTLRQEQCVSMRDGFESILTAEQLEEFQGLREAGKQHRGGRGANWMGDCGA